MNLVVRDFKGVENLSRYKNVLSESSWIYIYTYEELKDFFLFIIFNILTRENRFEKIRLWPFSLFFSFFFFFFFILRVYAAAVI